MTDLTARELINTILRSLAETRATFKKTAQPPSGEDTRRLGLQEEQRQMDEAANLKGRS
jgi:hypothetical protein